MEHFTSRFASVTYTALIMKQAKVCSLHLALFAHCLLIGGKHKWEQGGVNNWQKGCMLRISKIFSPRKQKGLVEIN
jgi:hypothetical protein